MDEEQRVAKMSLTPLLDVPETRVEEFASTMGATTSQAEPSSMIPSEDSYDIDIEVDNTITRPTKPSHVDFGKFKIKGRHIEVLNHFSYIDNVDWVRLGGDDLVTNPKEDKVIVFRSFLKASLRFPLHKTTIVILKRFNIYLHQLTPNTIVYLEIFIWVVWSQGVELDVEAFCEAFSQIHELHFQTKATKGLHNNFGCYKFTYRRGSMFPALAYQSKWPNEWAIEWFYMKNDLDARANIKGIIHTPIATCFGYKNPMCCINFEAQAAIVAFSVVCTHIGTRDLV
jgi:hypothetical protein